MSKGISPVIASILLILIVLSLATMYTTFVGRVATTQTEAGQRESQEITRALATNFKIDGVENQDVIVRNVGSEKIPRNSFILSIDELVLNYTMANEIPSGAIGKLSVSGLWKIGPGTHTLKLQGASFGDSLRIELEPTEDAVLDLRFDEGEGATTRDASSYQFIGTLTGGVNWTQGKVGNGIKLDGVNDQVTFLDDEKHRLDRFTLAAWVRPDSNSRAGVIGKFAFPPDGTYNYYLITKDGGDGCVVHVHNSTETQHTAVCPTGTMSTNDWYHIVGTADGSNLRIYTDGTLRAETTNVPIATLDTDAYEGIRIGTTAGTTNWFNGIIDEVLVYNTALTPDQLYVMKRV